MSYYQFNKKEILQKAKDKYCKGKAAEYYLKNKEELKEKSKNGYKNLLEEKKLKEYQRKKYQQLIKYNNELQLIKQEKLIKSILFC